MVNSTDSINVYRQIFNAVVSPNLWLPYFRDRGTLSGSIKAVVFYIVFMLFIMTLGSVSVNLLKPESTTTLAELLINPTFARNIIGLFLAFIVMSVVFVPIFLLIGRGADATLTLNRVFMVYLYAYSEIFLVKSIELFIFSLMSVFVLTNIVNMVFAGAVIFGTTLICGLLQIVLFFKTFKIVLDIPYLTIAVAGGIGGGISMFTLSLLEKIGL
ncbi:hypothetical protein [uncultured Veillonella sp.]|uniref:hypothetical protein n=1 Tax=uncultured Veillonella sp. TaxID=159268 RepID=UPI0025D0EF7D|nr:hypothetical protein [uncultured Veillonella sp.]